MRDSASGTLAYDPVVAEIKARLGRPLRVLHIGNIANNAYNNARIQRQYGIEADVLCHDYYHVMATPEWEDGGLTTKVDPGLPNWWATNLQGFRRPNWYVQGPLPLCLAYLAARQQGDARRLRAIRTEIEESYIDRLRLEALSKGEAWKDPRSLRQRYPGLVRALRPWRERRLSMARVRLLAGAVDNALSAVLERLSHRVRVAPMALHGIVGELRRMVVWPLLAAAVADPPRTVGAGVVLATYDMGRRLTGRDMRDRCEVARQAAELAHPDCLTIGGAARRVPHILARGAWLAVLTSVAIALKWRRKRADKVPGVPAVTVVDRGERGRRTAQRLLDNEPRENAASEALQEQFRHHVGAHSLLFGHVLDHYDVVQGYSIDGLIPLANGHPAFASYEHGTLRELPFEESLTGLICRVAYRNSPAVFVTNTDVLPSVSRLGLAPERVHYLPHAFDDQKLRRWREANAGLAPPAGGVTFFSPTRQHWQDANRSLTKGNDVMLKAAGRLWAQGRRFRLVLVEWGQDVEATRRLIDELGYSEAVRWVPPMGKQDLWRAYCTSHAVLDQFVLPALGGVGFETLTLGCRLITHTDQETLEHFFGAAPPVLAAGTVDEVARSMAQVIDDAADKAGVGAAGAKWIEDWHSARRIVAIQAEVYRGLLAGYPDRKMEIHAGHSALDGLARAS